MLRRALRIVLTILLWLVVVVALAATLVPRFLDRIYYRGETTGHFDGERFANPSGPDTSRPPAGGSRGGFFLRFLSGGDGRPDWPTSVPVAQVPPPARVAGQDMVVTWVGHATVLVQANGLNILTDPVWSQRAGPFGVGPARVHAPGIAFDRLPKIDVVLVSHNHYDHLDLATLKRIWQRDRPVIVTSLGNDSVIGQAGVPSVALDWGQGFQRMALCTAAACPTIDVAVTRNHHWSSRWFADRNRALWSSFVVRLPGGNLFFAGDTGLGDGRWADEARALGPIRLALIPIGAFRFQEGQMSSASHIGPIEAAEVYRRLGAANGIGVHWGTFRLSYEGRETPPRLLREVIACGGGIDRSFVTVPVGRPQRVAAMTRALRPAPAIVPPRADHAAIEACLDTPQVRALR